MALPSMKAQSSSKKAMKAMKAKRVSKIARGRMAKALVLRGRKEKTSGGLTSSMLMKNKRGKIVSKRASAHGKCRYANVEGWVESLMTARRELKMSGFVAVNGKTIQGKALYVKAKALTIRRAQAPPVASVETVAEAPA